MLRYVGRAGRRIVRERSNDLKGIIFDMDGTLTLPSIDFVKMRQMYDSIFLYFFRPFLFFLIAHILLYVSLGIPPEEEILRFLERQREPHRSRFEETICTIEEEGRKNLQPQVGCWDLLSRLQENQLATAIITSNNEAAVASFLQLCDNFDSPTRFHPILTRDDGEHFRKPKPAGVLQICQSWNVEPHEVLMVGDHVTDIMAGRDAGCATCLLLCESPSNHHYKDSADFHVRSLSDLQHLQFEVPRPIEWFQTQP